MLVLAGLFAVSVSACAPLGGGADQNLLGEWVLIRGTDERGEFDLGATSITLTVAQGEGSGGRTPCNSYFATISGGGDSLSVGEIGQTEAACVDEGLMDLEARYLAALAAVNSGHVTEMGAGGPVLKLSGTRDGGTRIELRYEHPR